MKKTMKNLMLTLLFLLLCAGMLLHSEQALYYALTGLQLWFNKMIPTLLPFMILSNLLIGLHLSGQFAAVLQPILGRLFQLDCQGVYALFMGFLCGFPMGAKVTRDLLDRKLLSKRDAAYLLAFCNNIGPVYFTGFVLPILQPDHPFVLLFGMYGLPLLYGLFLRHLPAYRPIQYGVFESSSTQKASAAPTLLEVLDDAIMSALSSVTKLGGYMIFFNLLNLLPDMLLGSVNQPLLAGGINCLLEITSGISRLQGTCPLLVLTLLPFGGFSCIAQTYSMIKGSGLSIRSYVLHKLILSVVTLGYYLFCA